MKDYVNKLKNLMRINFDSYLLEIMPEHYTRYMIKYIQSKKWTNIVGVEIGTEYGHNAKNIMSVLDIKKLYCIDPYKDETAFLHGKDKANDAYLKAKQLLSKYNNKIEIIRKTSIDALSDIPNNVDFVYIDGNHSYRFVKHDIEEYYPKVRKGGIIGGHDFDASHMGVAKAVFEFKSKDNINLYGKGIDWWIEK
jgi:predicted O-methyltransferase YrrM